MPKGDSPICKVKSSLCLVRNEVTWTPHRERGHGWAGAAWACRGAPASRAAAAPGVAGATGPGLLHSKRGGAVFLFHWEGRNFVCLIRLCPYMPTTASGMFQMRRKCVMFNEQVPAFHSLINVTWLEFWIYSFWKSWFGSIQIKPFPLTDTETQASTPVLTQISSQEKGKLI